MQKLNKPLILKDPVYGTFSIDSPVIIEIISSKDFQRLKKLNQYGIPDKYYHIKNHGTRYSHSIGVFLLLKKLGASLEEQLAGLTHDLSHTAFSHVVDWIWRGGHKEGFQDSQHNDFLKKSEISKIIEKYGLDSKRIGEHKNFNLLEQEIPDLCADRIDYSIQEFPKKVAIYCYKNLTSFDEKIVFKNKNSALIFARNFLVRQMTHWGGFEAAARYGLLAKALRIGLVKNIIQFDDFWKFDDFVAQKIEKSKNKEVKKILKILKRKTLKGLPLTKEKVFKKFRHVDPLFISNHKLIRLSDIDKEFKKELEEAKRINRKGIILPQV